jgi:hypothetical protein
VIHILDDTLPMIEQYRQEALALEYRSYDFEHCTFHGIAVGGPAAALGAQIQRLFPQLTPKITFFRKSPEGQKEPHFIHTDIDMGQWSAILYLNHCPPESDGTSFWTHELTGAIGSDVPHERSEEGKYLNGWERRFTVHARLNRLVMFPANYFHSRALYQNWGSGNDARLTQVVFGTGQLVGRTL